MIATESTAAGAVTPLGHAAPGDVSGNPLSAVARRSLRDAAPLVARSVKVYAWYPSISSLKLIVDWRATTVLNGWPSRVIAMESPAPQPPASVIWVWPSP